MDNFKNPDSREEVEKLVGKEVLLLADVAGVEEAREGILWSLGKGWYQVGGVMFQAVYSTVSGNVIFANRSAPV